MKDWEDIIKERQLSRKAELPESDRNDFLSRLAAHEYAERKRRRIISAAISIPAAAAVLLMLFIMPFSKDVPDNRISKNEPLMVPVTADSVDSNTVDSIVSPVKPDNEKAVIKERVPVKRLLADDRSSVEEIEDNHFLALNIPQASRPGLSVAEHRSDMRLDGPRFNSAAFSAPSEGTSIEDIIRKHPGVVIDDEGNITVNGKPVSRIFLNGKAFDDNGNNVQDDKALALTQLTADMIDKVKAYEQKSDLSRQTGIDDGQEETVLDINPNRKVWDINTISGMVVDSETDAPVHHATVQVIRKSGRFSWSVGEYTTDEYGAFRTSYLSSGKFLIHVSCPGYIDTDKKVRIINGKARKDIGKISIGLEK